MGVIGSIYLLCFREAFWHAKHYSGWTTDLDARLKQHAAGKGSRLMAAVAAKGIEWDLASVIQGDRHLERRLKKHGAARRCPLCQTKEVTPMDMENWQLRAACVDEDPEIFFPMGFNGWMKGESDAAKAVCRRCPVTSECLLSAIEAKDAWSVAGGLTPEERSLLVRQAS